MSVKSTSEAGNGLGGCSRCPPPTAINADFRPLCNYETKMVARTDKHPILTILLKIGDWEQSDQEQWCSIRPSHHLFNLAPQRNISPFQDFNLKTAWNYVSKTMNRCQLNEEKQNGFNASKTLETNTRPIRWWCRLRYALSLSRINIVVFSLAKIQSGSALRGTSFPGFSPIRRENLETRLHGRYLMYGDINCTDTFPFLLGTLLPCHSVTLFPCYLVTLLLCYSVTLLPCYLVTLLPCYLVTLLPCYLVTLLPCYLVTLLHCYLVTLLPCYSVPLFPY